MVGLRRKFRIRVIPVTLLWSVVGFQAVMVAIQVVVLCGHIADIRPTDLPSQWAPLLDIALLAWLLPTGAAAFVAGWFFFKGRWKAAAISSATLVLLWYLCLIPLFVAIANYPGPK